MCLLLQGGGTRGPEESKGQGLEVNAVEEWGQRSHGFCVVMCLHMCVCVFVYPYMPRAGELKSNYQTVLLLQSIKSVARKCTLTDICY